MDISFDPPKNARNIACHGISMERVAEFEWHTAIETEDDMPKKRKRKRTQTDPDNPFWTEADFRRARPAREFLVEQFGHAQAKKMLRPRGRPKTGAARTSISLRLPPEILARWKATGPGWQTRMVERLAKAK